VLLGDVGGVLLGDVGGVLLGDVGGVLLGDVGGPLDAPTPPQSVAGGEPGSPDETPTPTGVLRATDSPAAGTVQMTVPRGADDASTTCGPRVIPRSASVVVAWSIVCPTTSGIATTVSGLSEQIGTWHPGDPAETSRSTADP